MNQPAHSHSPNQRHDRHDAAELAPWFLVGALDSDDRSAVEAHSAECSSCRDEIARTAEALELATSHPSTLDLVEYALGLEAGEMDDRPVLDRELLERHIAGCASCQREIAMVTADETVVDVDFADRSSRRPAAARRLSRRESFLAMAAGLALATATGVWFGNQLDISPQSTPPVAAITTPTAHDLPASTQPETGSPDVALFFDGFESGDTGTWSNVSIQ